MGLVKVRFEELCKSGGEFSECGKLIEGIITNGIEINQEIFNDPKEIIIQCNIVRKLEDEERENNQLKVWDHETVKKLGKSAEGRRQPDLWFSKEGQHCVVEIKLDSSLNNLLFGSQNRRNEMTKLLACAEFPKSLEEDCRKQANEQEQNETEKQNGKNRIQDKLRNDLKSICGFNMRESNSGSREGKNKAIDGSIYDIFKWIKYIDKIKVSLSLAFFVDAKNSLYQCLDKKVCCERCLNTILCSLLKWKKVLNKQLNVSYNYHIKMAIYKGKMEEKDIPLILFMTETRYIPTNQPSNQTQGGST